MCILTPTAPAVRAPVDRDVLARMTGTDGHPDPIAAAVCKLSMPAGLKRVDLIQEARVAVLRDAPRYDPSKGRPFSWAYAVARNTALNVIEKHNTERRRTRRLRTYHQRQGAAFDPDAKRDTRAAVERLPECFRDPVYLVLMGDVPRPDAARQLGITVQELNARLAEAKRILVAELADHRPDVE